MIINSIYLFFCLLFFISQTVGPMTLTNGVHTQEFIFLKWSPPEVGELPVGAEFVAIVKPSTNLTGKIAWAAAPIYTHLSYTIPFVAKLRDYKNRGAVGVITTPGLPKVPGQTIYGSVGMSYPLPVSMSHVNIFYFASGLLPNHTYFNFTSYDENPWDTIMLGAGYIIFCLLTGGGFMINSCLSGYRLGKWIYTVKRIDYTIGFACLALEFVCNVLRVFGILFFAMRNNFLLPGVDILFTVPWLITEITSIIIVFFWLDLTSDPFYQGKFLGIMKWPAAIFIICCIILEVAVDVTRSLIPFDFGAYVSAVYSVSALLIVIFNFTAAYRILKPLKKAPDNKKKLKRIIYRILASGVATGGTSLIFFLFLGAGYLQWNPTGWCLLWFFMYFFFFLQSFLLILIFKVPKQTATSSSAKETKETE